MALRLKNLFIPYHNIGSIRLDGHHIYVITKTPHVMVPFSGRQIRLSFKSNENARSDYEYLINQLSKDQYVTPDHSFDLQN